MSDARPYGMDLVDEGDDNVPNEERERGDCAWVMKLGVSNQNSAPARPNDVTATHKDTGRRRWRQQTQSEKHALALRSTS